jgi:hypothetical protein
MRSATGRPGSSPGDAYFFQGETMQPNAALIQRPYIDFKTFLGLGRQALQYGLTAAADSCNREMSESERYLSYLAAMRDPHARAGLVPSLLSHVSFSVFVAAENRDMLGILQCATGMAFTVVDTVVSGVQIAVVTGTLAQWRDAVATGSTPAVEPGVLCFWNRVYTLFKGEGLQVWPDYRSRSATDQTFYLEDQRNR